VDNFSIGVDIGGTKVLGGVVDRSGAIVMTHREDTPKSGGAQLTNTIISVIKELLSKYPAQCVGISAAGFVSSDRQTMLATPNIADWDGVNLKAEISREIPLPVVIENDANAAAWGEAVYGAGQGERELMMVTVGTGIGGGLITNGELFRGSFGVAAEFGHMRLVPEGHPCGCGSHGCFEQYASGSALHRFVVEAINRDPKAGEAILARGDGTIEGLKGGHITDAARAGDEIAIDAFNQTAKWLGAGMASLSVVLDPGCIVVGGGVVDAADLLMKPTIESFERHMPFSGKHPLPKILVAKLGNDAGLVGVADLARR